MKKFLERQRVFMWFLGVLARMSTFGMKLQSEWLAGVLARVNIMLNKPKAASNTRELAERWKELMPPDGQDHFKISEITEDTAYVEIHLHCPLRGTGDVQGCYHLMNYDRSLMNKVGGELVVLDSQSNSGKSYCRLAIRPEGQILADLIPAHKKIKSK